MSNSQYNYDLTNDTCPADTFYDLYNVEQTHTNDLVCNRIYYGIVFFEICAFICGYLAFVSFILNLFDYLFNYLLSLCKINKEKCNLCGKVLFYLINIIFILVSPNIYSSFVLYMFCN